MSESLQLSIDLATSLSIIFAAGAFIYQQWKENYDKKELGLWQEIKEIIDSQGDSLLDAIRILIQFQYNAVQAEQEDLDTTLQSEYTEFLNIINTVKFRVQLDSKLKIEALLKRQDTYKAKKNKLDEIFIRFDNECNAFITQMETMRDGALELKNRDVAQQGLIKAIVGHAFMTQEKQAAVANEEATVLDTEFFNLYKLFENFSEDLFDLAHSK